MRMSESGAVHRAKLDIEQGRLWKARDRLGGLLVQRPADQDVLGLLGEVFFRMGDYPAAGRFWFLTTRTGPEVDIAMTAMKERYPNRQSLGLAIPVRAPIEAFPEEVQVRLLQDRLAHYLNPQARMQYPKGYKGPFIRMGISDPLAPNTAGRLGNALARATFGVVAVGGWLVGAIILIRASKGFVFVPIVVAAVITAILLKIDSTRRNHRLSELRQRQLASPSDDQ